MKAEPVQLDPAHYLDSAEVGTVSAKMTESITRPPVIGLTMYGPKETGRFYMPGPYVDAVHLAGGVPMLLPPVSVDPALMLERVDGLVFIGGGDIDPVLYNGSPHPAIYNVDPQRDTFELALAKLALATDVPMLGLCRGLQIMMVVSGGDIVPHLPDAFGQTTTHRAEDKLPRAEHGVRLLPASQLATIMGVTEVTAFSLHHQAVRTVPPGWRVTAWAPDGVIEALEHEQHPFAIAVQWHPELSHQVPYHRRLFQALIAAASARQVRTDKALNISSFPIQ